MTDLPVLEWSEYGECSAIAELGIVTLYAYGDRYGWKVEWGCDDESVEGEATSVEDAKTKARIAAKELLQQVLAQLDRAHDPVMGLVVQVSDTEAPHAR